MENFVFKSNKTPNFYFTLQDDQKFSQEKTKKIPNRQAFNFLLLQHKRDHGEIFFAQT
jgi:hypothetical protein